MYGRCGVCGGNLELYTDPEAWMGNRRETVLKCLLCAREQPLPPRLGHLATDKPKKEVKIVWRRLKPGRRRRPDAVEVTHA